MWSSRLFIPHFGCETDVCQIHFLLLMLMYWLCSKKIKNNNLIHICCIGFVLSKLAVLDSYYRLVVGLSVGIPVAVIVAAVVVGVVYGAVRKRRGTSHSTRNGTPRQSSRHRRVSLYFAYILNCPIVSRLTEEKLTWGRGLTWLKEHVIHTRNSPLFTAHTAAFCLVLFIESCAYNE